MAVTSSRDVTSGYFRNHLYVLLGINVLGSLSASSAGSVVAAWPSITAAVLSYVGAVAWLYETPRVGRIALVLVSVLSLVQAWMSLSMGALTANDAAYGVARVLWWMDPVSGGLLLGSTIAAMFLGHWYLNTPTMKLGPLFRLIRLMGMAVCLRAALCGAGLVIETVYFGLPEESDLVILSLRWLAGLIGAGAIVWMTWKTLQVPNTQSATGILYVGVIVTFLGELTAQLLSSSMHLPL